MEIYAEANISSIHLIIRRDFAMNRPLDELFMPHSMMTTIYRQ